VLTKGLVELKLTVLLFLNILFMDRTFPIFNNLEAQSTLKHVDEIYNLAISLPKKSNFCIFVISQKSVVEKDDFLL
jgi:hypothetical protein